MHAASSFNNPLYAFSVRNTRQAMLDRFDDLGPSRFCAGCHDPAILMSGSWEEDRWTDPAMAAEAKARYRKEYMGNAVDAENAIANK